MRLDCDGTHKNLKYAANNLFLFFKIYFNLAINAWINYQVGEDGGKGGGEEIFEEVAEFSEEPAAKGSPDALHAMDLHRQLRASYVFLGYLSMITDDSNTKETRILTCRPSIRPLLQNE